jgi:Mg2+/Co2+ transporter CorC
MPGVRRQPDGSVNVDGAVPIRDLNRVMDWNLPDEEATTIAGLVIHEARSIPKWDELHLSRIPFQGVAVRAIASRHCAFSAAANSAGGQADAKRRLRRARWRDSKRVNTALSSVESN